MTNCRGSGNGLKKKKAWYCPIDRDVLCVLSGKPIGRKNLTIEIGISLKAWFCYACCILPAQLIPISLQRKL